MKLARQSVIGIDVVLRARLVKDVSDALDNALLLGDGTDYSITGIINQDNTIPGDFDPEDPDTLLDAIGLLTAQEVMPNRWFINGADFVTLRKVKEASGSAKYVLELDLTADATYRLFGIPVDGDQQTQRGNRGAGRRVADRCGPRRRTERDRADRAVRRIRRGRSMGGDPLRPGAAAPGGGRGSRWRQLAMPIINGGDVAAFLGQGSDTTLVALAGEVAPVITAMVASYTRGRGFDDDEPNDELAAVITTASARLVANPEQIPTTIRVG